MANPDRLTALDSTFLHLEDDSTAHMHVASVMIFEGKAPTPQELVEHILSRLHLVPRYRQRLAYVPLGQGRPVWTDDPHFNPRYHIRHTALPKPADETALKQLAGRLFSQRLDRSKPLWEIWLVQRMAGRRFALIAKTHHALVDGISGVDITTVLFDTAPEPLIAPRPRDALDRQAAARAGQAARRGAARAHDRACGDGTRHARATARPAQSALPAEGQPSQPRLDDARRASTPPRRPARSTSTSAPTAATASLMLTSPSSRRSRTSSAARSTMSVLTLVSLALGRYLRSQGQDTEGLVLKAMVPVSVRADSERGALGNQVAAMWAPLPVGVENPARLPGADPRCDGGPQGIRPGGRRPGARQPRRVRPADDPQPGGTPAGAPALLQPRRNQRARAPIPAVPARAPSASSLSGRATRAPSSIGNRGHEL